MRFFGGDGVGFINMLLYIVLTVFIAGLMVGRTPEFLGKKVEGIREVKLASIALLLASARDPRRDGGRLLGVGDDGRPGYGIGLVEESGVARLLGSCCTSSASAAANNGSGFEGLGDNTAFWNISTGVVMLAVALHPHHRAAGTCAPRWRQNPPRRKPPARCERTVPPTGSPCGPWSIILGLLMFMPVGRARTDC